MTAYLDEAIIIDGKEYLKLNFRRPTGRDMRLVGATKAYPTYQLARVLCRELEAFSDEDFDALDYKNILKHIFGVVEGFMYEDFDALDYKCFKIYLWGS